jgi:uncharacterized membrane protein
MEELLHRVTEFLSLVIQAIAVVIIAIGVIGAVIGMFRTWTNSRATNDDKRAVWLEFARWLTAGLTFQLAADIVETTVAPTWDQIGRVAAIAVIRTFLTFFLDRDVAEIRERQHKHGQESTDAK